MGLRFRKSLRIAPGVRVNLSGSGVSTSIGPRGASVNVGARGSRTTVGLPGTGLSYSTPLSGGGSAPPGQATTAGNGCAAILGLGFIILLIGMCSSNSSKTTDPATPSVSSSELTYVTARSANCRSAPGKGASVIGSLKEGDGVPVAERSDGWTKVQSPTGPCWISDQLLSSAPIVASPGSTTQSLIAAGAETGASPAVSRPRLSKGSSKRSNRRRSSSGGYSNQGCPCSGSRVCIGPRGGRYCITSGGNKRYGV